MVKGKRRALPTRSLGAEPQVPDVPALAGWVAERRECREEGDLTTYLLSQALSRQVEAGITVPCAGGKFYGVRFLSSFVGIEDRVLVSETDVSDGELVADAMELARQVKGVWCAAPAPHVLNLADSYFGDEDEASEAIAGLYRTAMRAMRDAGIGGHVLICDRADDAELSALARQNVFFFHPAPGRDDLETLLEYQRVVAVRKEDLATLSDCAGEYDVHAAILMDPDEGATESALSFLDPENIAAGGYCTALCETYWQSLADSAFYRL